MISHNAADSQSEKSGYSNAAMMVHFKGESYPLAKSAEWDGGAPEVERNIEAAFPGLTLAIKLRGTTLAALGQRFVRTSFLTLGGISVLLAGGILLTYRNVTKEIALARLKSDFGVEIRFRFQHLPRAAHSFVADPALRRDAGDGSFE